MREPVPHRTRLGFWQIWNMSFGFLGIQFGFALQNANTSRIFQTLGADTDRISWYWLAAPVTGLFVQPLIGYLSDRTWHPFWGRRRPYFFAGSILASFALIVMPQARVLWLAIFFLWIMDGSINISMEPFRAFVGDTMTETQRTTGFAMQTFFIGCGAVVASQLPFLFTNLLHIRNTAPPGIIPPSVRYAFYAGAVVFLAAVMWTVFSTREFPPPDMARWEEDKLQSAGLWKGAAQIARGILKMPATMLQLALVQFFTWLAFFCMWIYTTPAVSEQVFHTHDPASASYQNAGDWVGVMFSVYNGVSLAAAFLLPLLARKIRRPYTHMICLITGGICLLSMWFIRDKYLLIWPMIGVGLAWSSTLTMPYAILAGAIPAEKMGFYMGIFNFFIVIPQIVASLLLGLLIKFIFHHVSMYAIVLGGASMILAGLLNVWVKDPDASRPNPSGVLPILNVKY
jgi:maltose/moltooligosaccharide transporter